MRGHARKRLVNSTTNKLNNEYTQCWGFTTSLLLHSYNVFNNIDITTVLYFWPILFRRDNTPCKSVQYLIGTLSTNRHKIGLFWMTIKWMMSLYKSLIILVIFLYKLFLVSRGYNLYFILGIYSSWTSTTKISQILFGKTVRFCSCSSTTRSTRKWNYFTQWPVLPVDFVKI